VNGLKITDVETIEFVSYDSAHSRWGFPDWSGLMSLTKETYETKSSITKIATDEGVEGLCFGGKKEEVNRWIKPLLIGEDPLDREKIWQWMYSITRGRLSEKTLAVVDMALWDLAGKYFKVPISKILGGFRDRVKAYASTLPNLGSPEEYAEHAWKCRKHGYKGYKIHPYTFYDPLKKKACPDTTTFPKEDIEICKAVREKVGEDMVLMFDPFTIGAGGGYSFEEAVWVGKELEKLNFSWFEQPLLEDRFFPYIKLCKELNIPILSPEMTFGSFYTRAEWLRSQACDIVRMECNHGGITAVKKCIDVCEAYGVKCEFHGGGFAHLQILAATSPKICEWYEKGLLGKNMVYNKSPSSVLKKVCDPMDDDGNVLVPQKPGLGMEVNWEYITKNSIE
jgi:L-alanine-DL-glutamate epimerase-like enolase superfamily enzyme